MPDDCAKDDFVEREIERIVGELKQPLHEYMGAIPFDTATRGTTSVIMLLRHSLGDYAGQYNRKEAVAIARGLNALIPVAKKMRGIS